MPRRSSLAYKSVSRVGVIVLSVRRIVVTGIVSLACVGCSARGGGPRGQMGIVGSNVRVFGGKRLLMVTDRANVQIDDKVAVQREAEAVWRVMRSEADSLGVDAGVVSITTAGGGGLVRVSEGVNVLFARDSTGGWRLLEPSAKN